MEHARFAVIDTETTGLDPAVDAVVSIAVVPVEDGAIRLAAARHLLVDPGIPIPPASTLVHGIRDDDVRGAPGLPAVLDGLTSMLAGRIVVGHNLAFDLAFLERDGLHVGQTLDTLAVSRLLWPRRGTRHTLDALAARLDVLPQQRHTALGDALATAEVLLACLPLLRSRGLASPDAVAQAYRAQRLRRARVRRSIRRRSMHRRTRPRLSRSRSAHLRR